MFRQLLLVALQHAEIDRASHRLIAGVVRMQIVAAVIYRLGVLRVRRIAHDCVEVDHAVELAARADPFVDRLADLLFVGIVIAFQRPALESVLERRQRRAENAQPVRGAPVLVAGDSAGANIAASAILCLSKDERRQIAGFVSLYGAYAPEMNLSSHRLYGDGRFGLSEAQMRWFWNLHAPQLPPEVRAEKLSPLARLHPLPNPPRSAPEFRVAIVPDGHRQPNLS